MKKRTFYATFLLFLSAIYVCMLSLSAITPYRKCILCIVNINTNQSKESLR